MHKSQVAIFIWDFLFCRDNTFAAANPMLSHLRDFSLPVLNNMQTHDAKQQLLYFCIICVKTHSRSQWGPQKISHYPDAKEKNGMIVCIPVRG